MKFVRIITQQANHAFFNMALDEAILEAVKQRLSPPTLRFYLWEKPSVSIGFFQKISEINTDYCSRQGYPVVRRLTGGRAILHDSELTYSLSTRTDSAPFKGTLIDNYTVISNALISGLEDFGLTARMSFDKKRHLNSRNPSCFRSMSFGEVTVEGKKIIGSAQKRYKDSFMQHGSIVLTFDTESLKNVLPGLRESDFMDVGALQDYSAGINPDSLGAALKGAFEETLKVKLISDGPTKFEIRLAKELEKNRYSSSEWNYRR